MAKAATVTSKVETSDLIQVMVIRWELAARTGTVVVSGREAPGALARIATASMVDRNAAAGLAVMVRGAHNTHAYVPVSVRAPPLAAAEEVTQMETDQEVEVEERQLAKVGKKDKSCGRYALKGHLAADCTNEVYCVICDGHDHVNHQCHLLKQPCRVAHVVGYAVSSLGFYHISHLPLSRKKDSKTALVKVVGSSLSAEQVVAQLAMGGL
nr:unnamed protein product [Digitaria exilis]